MAPKKAQFPPLHSESSPTSTIQKMSKEAPLSVAEREFILEALRQDSRLDGRGADQFRPLKISFGDEYGHVKLELGKTRYAHHSPGLGYYSMLFLY